MLRCHVSQVSQCAFPVILPGEQFNHLVFLDVMCLLAVTFGGQVAQ